MCIRDSYKDGGIGGAVIDTPFIPGHEFSALATEDVPEKNIAEGELVAVDPATPCFICEWCARGHHNLCPNVVFLGAPPYHGAMAPSLAVPRESLIKIPASMSAEQGAMLEPLGVCIHAIDLAKPKLVESVAVLGCGCIGLGILQLLLRTGCHKIVAIDPQPHRVEKALSLGAHVGGATFETVSDATNSRGCDLVIEATNSPAGLVDAVKAAAIGGRVILVGIPDGDVYNNLSASEARRRGLDIRFSRRMGDVYERAVKLVDRSWVDVDTLITHRFDLPTAADAFRLQKDEAPGLIKSMITPNKNPD